ncbi:MAG: YceI family protein [Nocardioides sp.]|nr:YceI family protein [Nocardioides sp.]
MNFFNRKSDVLEHDFDAATNVVEDISGDYTLDSTHSRIGFSARHAMVTTVRGQFTEFAGTAHIDAADPSKSSVTVTIQTSSVDTGVADRNAHLKSADFFDAETNPEIKFVSTDVSRDGEDWTINGELTINGITKPVSVEFEFSGSARDPFNNLRVGFEGGTTINRKDWGLTWNAALETGGVLVSEKIKLEFDVSAIQNATV